MITHHTSHYAFTVSIFYRFIFRKSILYCRRDVKHFFLKERVSLLTFRVLVALIHIVDTHFHVLFQSGTRHLFSSFRNLRTVANAENRRFLLSRHPNHLPNLVDSFDGTNEPHDLCRCIELFSCLLLRCWRSNKGRNRSRSMSGFPMCRGNSNDSCQRDERNN